MFSKRNSMIGMAVVATLTPILMAATPAFAQSTPATSGYTATAQKVIAMTSAPTQPGADPASATQPLNGWVQIPANGVQWYKFHYHYNDVTANPSETASKDQNTPTQAMVKLTMQNMGSVGFQIWTPGSLQNPVHNAKDVKHSHGKLVADHSKDVVQPVGTGTPIVTGTVGNSDVASGAFSHKDKGQAITNPQTLVWAGSSTASDTYYVVVKNNTNAPASYTLSISGPDVSFP